MVNGFFMGSVLLFSFKLIGLFLLSEAAVSSRSRVTALFFPLSLIE
jgi:hypothetical protein